MKRSLGISVVLVLAVSLASGAQTAGVAGNVPATSPAAQTPGGAAASETAVPDTRTEKQKTLARQTARLFDMATELKEQVDKTNKNILSLKVVEKAEEIELLAKGMKERARK